MAKPRLDLGSVDNLNLAGAKEWWVRLYREPAPSLSLQLVKFGIAYRIQIRAAGISEPKMPRRQRDRGRGKPIPRNLAPGTRLVRDWHGVGHVVTVVDNGFEYEGRHWSSLTAIARAITGGKWSGPRFFGLPA